MTHKKWSKLTPERKLLKIAELCGLKNLHIEKRTDIGDFGIKETWNEVLQEFNLPVPNYLHDLNDMHEVEMNMTKEQFENYIVILLKIVHNDKDFPPDRTVACASAEQRAKAFVLAMEPE